MSQRLKQLISLAAHSETPDNEALVAIRQIGRLIAKAEGGVDALFVSASAPAVRPLSFNASRSAIDKLETDLSVRNSTIARLEGENLRLSSVVFTLTEENKRLRESARERFGRIREDGTMPYDEFALRAKRILGSDWRVAFMEQTGIEEKTLIRMSVNGVATKSAVDSLTTLKMPALTSLDVEKQFWRPEEVQIIRELAPMCSSEQELAERASDEISKRVRARVITASQIHTLVVDSKGRNNIFRIAGYGTRPIVVGEPQTRRESEAMRRNSGERVQRAAAFTWTIFPDIERELAINFLGEPGGGRRKSARVWADEIMSRTGRVITEGAVKQRLNNAEPPKSIVDRIVTKGPLTWAEVWWYGAKMNKRAWNKEIWSFLNLPSRNVGDDLSDIPEGKIESLRAWGRQKMSERELVCDVVKHAGPKGIRRDELRSFCQTSFSIMASNRVNELAQRGDLFVQRSELHVRDDIIIHSIYR